MSQSAIRVEQIGDATLYLGDCLEILPTLGKVDAVVTDPPYFGREDLFPTDAVADVLATISELPAIVFWPWYGPDPLPNPDAIHIWHKAVPIHPNSKTGNVAGHHYERVFSYRCGSKSEVFREAAIMPNFVACADEFTEHPTQKPLGLTSAMVRRTKAQTILDPFMGSGTTGVACANLGRKFIGIEISPEYFDIACRRIEEAYRQPHLFEEPKPKAVQTDMLEAAQ